ncbi:MAG: type II toxin-antitoxin system HicB family antitoxin [Candidatus Diapherotrites archaeon]|nr:type II toxin-antitoxin system HicB family antitoxin [Candidatus Diapherotrites archaeon]
MKSVKHRSYKVALSQDEDGIFVAECLDLPGCISQGKTAEEALENIRDAIKGYLESLREHPEEKIYRRVSKVVTVKI